MVKQASKVAGTSKRTPLKIAGRKSSAIANPRPEIFINYTEAKICQD
jgi:hypothetical protein